MADIEGLFDPQRLRGRWAQDHRTAEKKAEPPRPEALRVFLALREQLHGELGAFRRSFEPNLEQMEKSLRAIFAPESDAKTAEGLSAQLDRLEDLIEALQLKQERPTC